MVVPWGAGEGEGGEGEEEEGVVGAHRSTALRHEIELQGKEKLSPRMNRGSS